MSDVEARITEVLGTHHFPYNAGHWESGHRWDCACGEHINHDGASPLNVDAAMERHVAAMLAPVIREEKAEALREAAGAYGPAQISGFFPGRDGYTKAWLHARADNLEAS